MPDLERAVTQWSWLLLQLGYHKLDTWPTGSSWRRGFVYIVLEESRAMVGGVHERMRPGLNHLAFHGGTREDVSVLAASAGSHGWRLLLQDRHPFAGGPQHFAAYLENSDGFEVEIVASE